MRPNFDKSTFQMLAGAAVTLLLVATATMSLAAAFAHATLPV